MREVAKADGSVGRIFEGHLNALRAPDARRDRPRGPPAGRLGRGSRSAARASRRSVEGDRITGVKIVLLRRGRPRSRARDRARARSSYVDLDSDTSRSTGAGTAPAGCARRRATACIFHGARVIATLQPADPRALPRAATRSAPRRAGRGSSTRRSRRRSQTSRPSPRPTTSGRSARDGSLTAQATIDRWFEHAAQAGPGQDDLDPAARGARGRRPRRSSTRRAGRPAHARSRRARQLDRARRDFELFVLQHRLDPFVARLGRERIEQMRNG